MSNQPNQKTILMICVLVLTITIILFMKSCEKRDLQAEQQQKTLDFTELPEQEYIELPSFETLYLKSGTIDQDVDFTNPESNKCYFIITIKLSDDTVIYKSDKLNPGETLTQIKLNQTLKRGIYENCQLIYNCFSLEDEHEQNGGLFKIRIYSK